MLVEQYYFLLNRMSAPLSQRTAAQLASRSVPEADVMALAEELIDKAVQRKGNEHRPADNVDVFFQH